MESHRIEQGPPQTSYWFSMTGPWTWTPSARKQPFFGNSHSRALPLSDGYHILFTDDDTRLLCLGADLPPGSAQRLSRKFIFEPPPQLWIDEEPPVPNMYAAGFDLENGARIAAAYGDSIVIYSVPIDALKYSTAEQEETLQALSEPFEELETVDILTHPASKATAILEAMPDRKRSAGMEQLNMAWTHWLPAAGDHMPESPEEIWPLRIPGTYIGSTTSPVALSVQAGSAIAVWTWDKNGAVDMWHG